MAKLEAGSIETGPRGLWLRIRGVPDPATAKAAEVAEHRQALEQLRGQGGRACVLLTPSATAWAKGVRAQPLAHIPRDLREAQAWMARLQSAYGDVVDAWEIENEPDLQFVVENPETYAAYLKACWWGANGAAGNGRRTEDGGRRTAIFNTEANRVRAEAGKKTDLGSIDGAQRSALRSQLAGSRHAAPLVLMGAMAIPPGPYLERFVANDGLTYADGFNYHFYGHAQDFSGVYRQFERAVRELTAGGGERNVERGKAGRVNGGRRTEDGRQKTEGAHAVLSEASVLREKTLPIFITEYGYSMLSGDAAGEKEGRIRQWEHFRDVGTQARKLRIEGAMAFLFMPYLEYGAKEYGITMRPGDRGRQTEDGVFNTEVAENAEGRRQGPKTTDQGTKAPEDGGPNVESRKTGMGNGERRMDGEWRMGGATVFRAGGLDFRPGDFGVKRAPWMEGIGQNVGGYDASPAMAWLMDDASTPRKASRGWKIKAAEPCAVVIDFLGGPEIRPLKQCQGYFLGASGDRKREGGLRSTGTGELRVYNLGREPITGSLDLGAFASCGESLPPELTLAPGELRVLPVTLAMTAEAYQPKEWRVRFRAKKPGAVSSFSTLLYPSMRGMIRKTLKVLTASEAGSRNTQLLAKRALAKGEPTEVQIGSWRVTPGVDVREEGDTWTFTVNRFPDAPTRPAFAEWVLPDDFHLPAHSLLNLEYRLVEPDAETGLTRVPTVADRSPLQRDAMGIFWRTAEGSLFTVWRPPAATKNWQRYAQTKESFTMAFYGRAGKHWRFSDSRPVALVFTFLPGVLPSTFQVRKAEILEYVRREKLKGEG